MPRKPASQIGTIADNNSGSIGAINVVIKAAAKRTPKRASLANAPKFSATGNHGPVHQAENLTIHYKEAPKRAKKEQYADGTIGRNANKRNYCRYLLDQYYKFKKADLSFGMDPTDHERIMNGLFPVVNNTIRKHFGAYPNGLPEEKFPALVEYMQAKIDGTRLGKVNKKAGKGRYKSFEEFCALGE